MAGSEGRLQQHAEWRGGPPRRGSIRSIRRPSRPRGGRVASPAPGSSAIVTIGRACQLLRYGYHSVFASIVRRPGVLTRFAIMLGNEHYGVLTTRTTRRVRSTRSGVRGLSAGARDRRRRAIGFNRRHTEQGPRHVDARHWIPVAGHADRGRHPLRRRRRRQGRGLRREADR